MKTQIYISWSKRLLHAQKNGCCFGSETAELRRARLGLGAVESATGAEDGRSSGIRAVMPVDCCSFLLVLA